VQVQRHEARGAGRSDTAQQQLGRDGFPCHELPVLPGVFQTWSWFDASGYVEGMSVGLKDVKGLRDINVF